MKFTKEERSLCKQVAEKHRKEIEYGDWYIDSRRKEGYQTRLCEYQGKQNFGKIYSEFTPLWTISDCLEFLRERAFYLEGLCQIDECEFQCAISEMDDMGVVKHSKKRFEGESELEACLKAVLAVLEEKTNG